jgi:hypothetical protein
VKEQAAAPSIIDDCPPEGVQDWLRSGEPLLLLCLMPGGGEPQSLRAGALHLPDVDAIWPERCRMIDVHMPDAIAQWLLLDRPGAPQAGATCNTCWRRRCSFHCSKALNGMHCVITVRC